MTLRRQRRHDWTVVRAAILLLAASILGVAPARAAKKEQASEGSWPPITPEERALKKVEQDPEADAVILTHSRIGKIIRKGDDTVNVMSYHWRLKVLNERGKEHATVHIPAQKYSRVAEIEARTIKPDGTIVPVAADQIFEKVVSRVGGFKRTEWVFSFPAVEPGAILEYRFKRNDNFLLFIEPWYFDDEEYTLRSEMSQAFPSNMAYAIMRQNSDVQPSVTDWREGAFRGHQYTLELKDVRPFKDELYMPPRREVSPRLEFVLTAWGGRYSDALGRQDRLFIDWPSVAKYSRYNYREAMKKGQGAYKTMVEGWMQGAADPQAKIKAALTHVQRDFSYLEFDNVVGDMRTLETILKDKKADNEEKAVLLSTALKIAGIESSVALVVGNQVGSVNPKFYSLSQFSHGVVAVDKPEGGYQWVDPTVTYGPLGFMPAKDSGADALLLKTDEGELMKIPVKNELNTTKYDVAEKPRPDGRADLEVTAQYTGEDAVDMRNDLAPTAETARLSYLQDWVTDHRTGASLKSHSIENLDDPDKPLIIKMSIEAPGLITSAEGILLVRGCALSCEETNPISRGRRQYPFVLARAYNEEEKVAIQPVDGMKAGTLPSPITVRSEIGTLSFSCSSAGDGRTVCSRQFVARRIMVPPAAQDNIRAMYDKIVEADRSNVAFQPSGGAAGGN